MAITPKASWPRVQTMLYSVYDQIDAKAVAAQSARVIIALGEKLPAVADHLDEWTEGRRYLGLDVLARSRITLATDNTGDPSNPAKEVTTGTAEPLTA